MAEKEERVCELSEVGEIRINSRYSKPYRIWKELMDRYHYLVSGPLCGQQMKYLIERVSGMDMLGDLRLVLQHGEWKRVSDGSVGMRGAGWKICARWYATAGF